MRIFLPDALFASPPPDLNRNLMTLLDQVLRRQHSLELESDDHLLRWLSGLGPAMQEFADEVRRLGDRDASRELPGMLTIEVRPDGAARWEIPRSLLPLSETIEFIQQPLGILLENGNNDWNFLLAICRRGVRDLLEQKMAHRLISVLHGGGDTLGRELEKRMARPPDRLRTFVIFDSDRLHPDELLEGWRPGSRDACNAAKWKEKATLAGGYWMLQRRFIESYLPLSELDRHVEERKEPERSQQAACLRIVRDLEERTRWVYNMKDGLESDQKRHDHHRLKGLYDSHSERDRQALAKGFGAKLATHYARASEWDFDPEARREADRALADLLRIL